jgi:hypothetical protein
MKLIISRDRAIQIQNKLRKANQTEFDSALHYQIAREWALDIYEQDARRLALDMKMDVPWFGEKD